MRGIEISGIFGLSAGFTGLSITSFDGGKKENGRILVFRVQILPVQVHISLFQHCGIESVGYRF